MTPTPSTPLLPCPRIYTRCPACHNDTLTINNGHLLCTWIDCKDPVLLERLIEAWNSRLITEQVSQSYGDTNEAMRLSLKSAEALHTTLNTFADEARHKLLEIEAALKMEINTAMMAKLIAKPTEKES